MTQALTQFGTLTDMRATTANLASLRLIQESCFLSPERYRHVKCRKDALDILEWVGEGDDVLVSSYILDGYNNFAMRFHCHGAAYMCSCGELVPNGSKACPNCGQVIDEPVGVLAIPQWETRLTLSSFEIAIATEMQVASFMGYSIHRTVRLIVLRNLLSQSDRDHYEVRAKEIRKTLLDRWPEGEQPDANSWQFRFIRASALFWLVGWPMLKKAFSLEEIDALFDMRLIKAVAVSAPKWQDAGADPADYAKLVRGILETSGLNKEKAILALSPADLEDVVASDNGEERKPRAVVLHPPELLMRGSIVTAVSGLWLAIPVSEPEVEILEATFGVADWTMDELIAKLEEEQETE